MREIIHIGFPKTATTTLQDHLFGTYQGLVNVARPFADGKWSELCTALALGDDHEYCVEDHAKIIGKSRTKTGKLLVYSDETVVNSPIRSIAAKRLKALFPDAHILAVLRCQPASLASFYANSGRRLRPAPEPYSGRHVEFQDYLDFQFSNPKRGFLATLSYDEILGFYEELFGKERVHVLLFEEFLQDRSSYISRLSDILGVGVDKLDKSLSGRHSHKRTGQASGQYQALRSRFLWGVPLSRIVPGSTFIKQALFRIWGDKPLDVIYPEGWEEKIGDLFRNGNRNLRDRYGLPLEKYGYPL